MEARMGVPQCVQMTDLTHAVWRAVKHTGQERVKTGTSNSFNSLLTTWKHRQASSHSKIPICALICPHKWNAVHLVRNCHFSEFRDSDYSWTIFFESVQATDGTVTSSLASEWLSSAVFRRKHCAKSSLHPAYSLDAFWLFTQFTQFTPIHTPDSRSKPTAVRVHVSIDQHGRHAEACHQQWQF